MEGLLIALFIIFNMVGITITLSQIDEGFITGIIIGICRECNILGKICIPIFFIALFPVAIIGEILIRLFIWLFTIGKK